MSNTPGISPITPDIEEIGHSDEDGFFGDECEHVIGDEDTEEPHTDDDDRSPPQR